jgi:hypothetical protein
MSSTLTNIQLGTSVSTLDGLSVINADQLFVNGENVNPASPNIPIQPSTSNFVHPIVVTTSFGPQTASVLNVDGNTYLGYNPSLRILYTDKLTIGSQIIANGISPGTPLTSTYLALNSSNQVITTAVPATSLVSIVQIAGGYSSPLYFCFITSTASGAQVIYSDDLMPITYNTNNKTLTIKNLSATAGSWNNTGTTFSQILNCGAFSASSTATFPQYCNFSTAPNVGTPAYFLALNAVNEVVVATGISAQPTITATNTNGLFYLTFAPNATTTSSSALYVDGGASLTYNAFSNTLTVPIADIPTSLTANGSFTANGTNSIAGYATTASLNGYLTKTGTNTDVNTIFKFGPTLTDSFEVQRNDGVVLMKLVQNSSQTMTIYNLLMTGVLQAYIFSTSGSAYLGTTLQVVGNTTLSTATGVTPAAGDNSTSLATTSFVATSFAPLFSPIFTGTPNAPTQSFGNNSTALATTAFVQAAIPAVVGVYLPLSGGTMTGQIGIDAGNLAFLQFQNDKNVSYSYTIGSNGTSGANTFFTFRTPASMIGVAPLLTIAPPTSCSSTLDVSGATTITGQTTSNGGLIINSGGLNYANFGGSSLNLIRGNTVFYGSVATGGNAVLQVDWASGINASVLNTATYNWQFVTGGSGTTAMNLSPGGLIVSCQYLQLNNASAPHIIIGGGSGNYIGYATGPGNFISDAATGDLCINSRTGNIRLAGGAQYTNTSMLISNAGANFNVAGVAVAGYNTIGLYSYNAGYMTNHQGALNAGLSGTGNGDLVFFANGATGVMRFYNGVTCKVAIGADRIYADRIEQFGPTTFSMPGDVTFRGVPSIKMEGGGVNWFMGGTHVGYWDQFASGWRMNAFTQLSIGTEGGPFLNIKHKALTNILPSAWDGGVLFTNTYQSSVNSSGLNIGSYDSAYSYGFIVSLRPAVAWNDLYLNAQNTYVYVSGALAVYSVAGGWISVSDEREKTESKPLKTNRSLERVLAAKTYTYKRKTYLDSSGNDLVKQEDKDKFHIGIMAQQIQESNPHCLSTWKDKNTEQEERFGVNYNDYVVHLLGAVQEQQKQIQQLIDHVSTLTNQVNELTKRLG